MTHLCETQRINKRRRPRHVLGETSSLLVPGRGRKQLLQEEQTDNDRMTDNLVTHPDQQGRERAQASDPWTQCSAVQHGAGARPLGLSTTESGSWREGTLYNVVQEAPTPPEPLASSFLNGPHVRPWAPSIFSGLLVFLNPHRSPSNGRKGSRCVSVPC